MNQTRYQQVKEQLIKWNQAYFLEDKLLFPESLRDQLKKELLELEAAHPSFISPDSPSQNIGSGLSEKFTKHPHQSKKYSLQDCFNIEELLAFFAKAIRKLNSSESFLPLSIEPKIDGLNITVWYKNGEFYKALTRGNGKIGEDVTHTVSTITSVPSKLNQNIDCEVTGEVCILRADFEKLNAEQELKYMNPRNLASGSIRQIDARVAAERKLQFFAYQIGFSNNLKPAQTQSKLLNDLKKLGFMVQSKNILVQDAKSLGEQIQLLQEQKDSFPYEIDGLAVKINDLALHAKLGHTVKCPRFAAAYKFPASQKLTQVLDIQVQVGRTGVLTPVAYLEPTLIDGSVVSRATLHNQDEIDKKDVRIGDTVVIQKAGDIIPEVVEVLQDMRPKNAQPYTLPTICPACGSTVQRDPGQAALRCKNPNCSAQVLAGLKHFVSKKGLNIEGLAVKSLELLLQEKLLSSPADLYKLQSVDLAGLPSFAEKKIENLISEIQKSKQVPLPKFLFALNIRHLGEKAALDLSQFLYAQQNIHNPAELSELLSKLDQESLLGIEGIGAVIAASVYAWFQEELNQELLQDFSQYGISFLSPPSTNQSSKFSKLSFVFTGSLKQLTRDQAQEKVRLLGGKTPSSLSQKTDYLVYGEKAGSKLEKANKLGVKTISEQEFINWLPS